MSKLSFVYFDVGGVVIKDFSDTDKWHEMLDHALLIPTEHHQAFDQLYDQYEDDICLGKIAVDDLQPFIKERFHSPLPPDFSILNYFVANFSANKSLWPIITNLQTTHRVGLLTDQYLGMFEAISAADLLPPVTWDAVIDSSKLGVRKPMPEIYQIAQDKAGVPGSEILFIDNREKNLLPARRLGWQTYLYDSKNYQESSRQLASFLNSL